MKKQRLSYQKVEKMVADWNAERGLQYKNKGFLILANDNTHHFLSQISQEGRTCQISIATDGSLRDCVDSLYKAEEMLKEEPKEIDWRARFFLLRDAVQNLSANAEYSISEGCSIPMSGDWDWLEKTADYYAEEKPVKPLKKLKEIG